MIVYRSTTSAFLDTVFKHDIEAVIRVAAEYRIPQTSKRIDMLLSGLDHAGWHTLVIVELKQWEHASRTPLDGVVRTRFAGGNADASRPSYQSWSYAELLRNFNAAVDEADVPLQRARTCTTARTARSSATSITSSTCRAHRCSSRATRSARSCAASSRVTCGSRLSGGSWFAWTRHAPRLRRDSRNTFS
jgi:hypothetical protein